VIGSWKDYLWPLLVLPHPGMVALVLDRADSGGAVLDLSEAVPASAGMAGGVKG
jgi:ABC-type glycerol-3-phosphate transport system permease component